MLVQCPEMATDVCKYMAQILDGLELSQWYPKVKHTRPCHCCLLWNGVLQFYQELKDAACHLKQLKPYTLWSTAVEREIKELKKGTSHKLLWSEAPKCLCDNYLELEAYIMSNTAHNIYKFDREVPETVMSGETSGIS